MNRIDFSALYGDAQLQKKRYQKTALLFKEEFGRLPELWFSAPGRTEVCGNHTDHNHGIVAAAAVDMDIICALAPTEDGIITVKSEGFPGTDIVDTRELEIRAEEYSSSCALIRGVAKGFFDRGYRIGGFTAYTSSQVLKGSGLSSSAAFEVLVGTALNHLYNGGEVSAVEIAQIAQFSENVYFGKPSGLMDQMASSVGSFISIDFMDPSSPVIDTIDFDPARSGLRLCIIDTRGSHAELTPEYAAIPAEMKAVAGSFKKDYLRELDKSTLISDIARVRQECGDRAVLRALHFFDENDRVISLCRALRAGDTEKMLEVINLSGRSSFDYLQNVYASSMPGMQSVSLALYTCGSLLGGRGAYRVHGGGFAGTVQAFVPEDALDYFRQGIESVFGEGSCHVLNFRPCGGVMVDGVSLSCEESC